MGQSKSFQRGFQLFRLRYQKWLSEFKIKKSEEMDPYQQFKEEADSSADKYFVDKSRNTQFRPRRTNTFRPVKIPENKSAP